MQNPNIVGPLLKVAGLICRYVDALGDIGRSKMDRGAGRCRSRKLWSNEGKGETEDSSQRAQIAGAPGARTSYPSWNLWNVDQSGILALRCYVRF